MQSKRRRACAVAGAVLAMGSWAFADHFSASWTFAGPGNWANGVNWSTNPNPPINNGDTYDAIIALPDAEVMLFDSVGVVNFTFSAGTFTGGGTVNVGGAALITGGTIRGSGAINIDNTLGLSGGEKIIGQRTINIAGAGSVVWSSGDINAIDEIGGGGIINNAGTWQDDTDSGYFWGNAQAPVFNNTGTLLKVGGSTDFMKFFYPVLNNDGFVNVQGSGIRFTGGGLNTGSFNVGTGAMLGFSDYNQFFDGSGAPTTVFSSTSVILSDGTVEFGNDFGNATTSFGGQIDSALIVIDTDDLFQAPPDEGRVTFVSGSLVNTINPPAGALQMKSGVARFETGQGSILFGTATFDGGIVHTADELFFNTITWTTGTIMGDEVAAESGISVSTGSLQLLGTGPKALQDVSFFNGLGSHATMSEGSLTLNRAQIINLATELAVGSFDFQGAAILANVGVDNNGTEFINHGLLVKSAGEDVAELRDLILNNDGEVRVEVGTLRLNGGGFHTGSMHISTGTTLELGMGAHLNAHVFDFSATLTADENSTLRIVGDTELLNGSLLDVDQVDVDDAFVLIEGGLMRTGALNLTNAASVNIAPDFNKTVKVKSISFVPFEESQFDLANNKMIVDYDPGEEDDIADQIRQYIAAGHNTGTWDGEMMITSLGDATQFALGYGDNSILGYADFGDWSVDADSVLIKYTYYGDANLDGTVNVADLVMLAQNWKASGLWTEGDFNYDGMVDKTDLGLMAQNWHAGNITPLGPALEGLGLPGVSVPEPGAMACLQAGAYLVLRRKRRSTDGSDRPTV